MPENNLPPTSLASLTLASVAALQAASIRADVSSVQLLGYNSTTDAGGMFLRRVGSSTAWTFQSADGAFWMPQYDTKLLNAAQFGLVNDGTYNQAANNLQGTTTPGSGVILMPSTSAYVVGMNIGDGNVSRRIFQNCATSTSTTVTGNGFLQLCAGAAVTCALTGIPANTTIASIQSDTSLTLSAATTTTVAAVTLQFDNVSAIPAGATIGSIVANTSITLASGVVATAYNLGAIAITNAVTASSTTLTAPSGFSALSVGMRVAGTGIPALTTIAAIASDTSLTLSQAATASGTITATFTHPLTDTPNLAGRVIAWSGAVGGTDNAPMLQAAINYAIQNRIINVTVPPGNYRHDDTIHLGYGPFSTVNLICPGMGAYAGISAGVSFYPTKVDRPAFNVQGCRNGLGKGFSILGQNYLWAAYARGFAHSISEVPKDWLAPNLRVTGTSPGGLQQHSPYAGLTIDAYSAVAPADAYPQQVIPAWATTAGAAARYVQGVSSLFSLEDVTINGFAVNYMAKPNGDGNGDYLRIRGLTSNYAVYGLAAGHTQSRNFRIVDLNCSFIHSVFTGTKFGAGSVMINGPLENWSSGQNYQIFDGLPLGFTGPVNLDNVYCEDGVRIGDLTGTGSFPNSIRFRGGVFKFGEGNHGQIPAAYMLTGGNQNITFAGTQITGNQRINTWAFGGTPNLVFDSGAWNAALGNGGASGTAAKRQATNFCGGILYGSARYNSVALDHTKLIGAIAVSYYLTNTSVIGSQLAEPDVFFSNVNRAQITQFNGGFVDNVGRRWHFNQVAPPQINNTGTYMGIPPALSGDTMTFTMLPAYMTATHQYRFAAGDILIHGNTGTIFIVTAIGAVDGSGNYPVTCLQQNNMLVNPTTGAMVANLLNDQSVAGQIYVIKTGYMVGRQVEYGTFTSGSTAVASVSRGDGYGGDITSYLANGDLCQAPTYNDTYSPWPIPNGATLSGLTNGSPGSLTLSANAVATGRFPITPFQVNLA